jgi:chorismate mutase
MPPSNSNSTSASTLSRRMRHLRTQVDRIDLKILRLLQQRTKLARRIGETKRRHRAVIYVPERERELLRRVARLSRGKLPARAVTAIFREILSSSRAEQGQGAIGLLRPSAAEILPAARGSFGACDEFLPFKTWPQLAARLADGSLALALLTGDDLARILRSPAARRRFPAQARLVADFTPGPDLPLGRRIFVVTPPGPEAPRDGNRAVILIECKSRTNTVKSWLKSMPECSLQAQQAALRIGAGNASAVLMRLTSTPLAPATRALRSADVPFSVLGLYQGTEDYGG